MEKKKSFAWRCFEQGFDAYHLSDWVDKEYGDENNE